MFVDRKSVVDSMFKAIQTEIRFFLALMLGCYLMLHSSDLYGQGTQSFPEPNGEYLQAVEVFMTSSKNKKYTEVFKDFKSFFNSGVLTDEELSLIHI